MYELSSKYGVASSDQVPLPARLDELREHIRREIRKVCRVSFVLLRATPLPRTSFSLFFSVHRNIHSSMARASSTDPSHDRRVSFRCSSVTRVLSTLCLSFSAPLKGRGTEKFDMCQATVDPWHAR